MEERGSVQTSPTYIACVGAVYIDTILTVPHYPGEDDKLRATSLSRRRGGNCPNTLEVLSGLLGCSTSKNIIEPGEKSERTQGTHLYLCAASLPDRASADSHFISESLSDVNLSYNRSIKGHDQAASSYIIRSNATSSRTIVNYNDLPEMTLADFQKCASPILERHHSDGYVAKNAAGWWHFEGRIPEITLQCIEWLRSQDQHVRISVEIEKPAREGLESLEPLADVVFYSRSWAEHQGFTDAEAFLNDRAERLESTGLPGQILTCTWGAHGATVKVRRSNGSTEHREAPCSRQDISEKVKVVDSIGAGDTFIAGMIYGLAGMADLLDTRSTMGQTSAMVFATNLATTKVKQEGFNGLADRIMPLYDLSTPFAPRRMTDSFAWSINGGRADDTSARVNSNA